MSSSLAQEEADRYFSTTKPTRTSHPEDISDDIPSPDERSDRQTTRSTDVDDAEGSDEDALHDYNNGKMSATATATYTLPSTLFDANTGPKGVIADAASFERAKKRSFRRTLYNLTQNASPFSKSANKESRSSSPEQLSSEVDNDEEEFMRRWRENRVRELQAGAATQRRASPSKRKYGNFDEVDANGYLDAVEKLPSETVVVVCIFDPNSAASAQVEKSLSTLAQTHCTTRFIKLNHEIAEMDHIGVPAILAYKGGDVFATVMNIKQEKRGVEQLEALLQGHRVLL